MRLTLLIPELIWPEPACPTLETLLARGLRVDATEIPATFDAAIARCFGFDRAVPYAALRLLGEGLDPGEHHWTCADPVHLRLHQERLILADGSRIDVAIGEAEALTGELNRYFGDIGEFRAATPERWYLRLSAAADFETPPLSAMAGRRILRQLPEEGRTAWLRKLLNEAQMLLHGHAVNETRTDAGRMTINSLWLWGPGQLPRDLKSDWQAVCSDHPLARGLARCTGVPAHAAPRDFAALTKIAGGNDKVLVTVEALQRAVQYEDIDAWRTALADLERDWFVPLAAAIRLGRVTLELRTSTIYGELGWQVGRNDLWKLWKRPQPLLKVAQRLAAENAAGGDAE